MDSTTKWRKNNEHFPYIFRVLNIILFTLSLVVFVHTNVVHSLYILPQPPSLKKTFICFINFSINFCINLLDEHWRLKMPDIESTFPNTIFSYCFRFNTEDIIRSNKEFVYNYLRLSFDKSGGKFLFQNNDNRLGKYQNQNHFQVNHQQCMFQLQQLELLE